MKIRVQIDDKSEWFDNIEDAIDYLKEHEEPIVTLYHIGGYELLRDGTQEESYDTVEDLKGALDDIEMPFDDSIDDLYVLAESIEGKWADRYDDGGGSGWINYKKSGK